MSSLRHILLLLSIILTTQVLAQAVKTDFDKKIIYTDSLNMPRNTSASTIIPLLPELLQRPGDFILSNYTVKVSGVSVGSAADVALLQLQIVDIEKIEVSDSPVSSYQNNGQGGSINLVLRTTGSNPDNKVWGSAGMHAAIPADIAPQVNIGYKNKNFMLRGIILGETQDLSLESQTSRYDGEKLLSQNNVTNDYRFRTEWANTNMQYDINSRDRIKLDISETYSYKRTKSITEIDTHGPLSKVTKTLNVQANLSYKHTTKRSAFSVTVNYVHRPSWTDNDITDSYNYKNDKNGNVISGKVDFKTSLFDRVDASNKRKRGELSMGINFNTSFENEKERINDDSSPNKESIRDIPQNDTQYFMPFVSFNASLGRLRLKAAGEFQHFKYKTDRSGGKSHTAVSNDFTGKIMAEWYFKKSRNVRFILDRKLKRPSSSQLYPYLIYSSDRLKYIEGNPDLKPMMVHNAAIEYIGTYDLGYEHKLIFNTGVSISSITDIINNKMSSSTDPNFPNEKLEYLTYENKGSYAMANANLMALYTYKAFSLSFTGNLYSKVSDSDSGDKYYTYYNLSIYPYFRLKNGWNGGARIAYYSHINQRDASLGDCAVADITFGKAIKRFFIFVGNRIAINKNIRDVSTDGSKRTEKKYQMVSNSVGIGLKYTF